MGERLTKSRPSSLTRWVPAFVWLECYEPTCLQADVVAGLTAAAVVVPQAMAYGAIAGLPLVVGLYTALLPLVVYAVMGTSRPLSVTTTSTIDWVCNRPADGNSGLVLQLAQDAADVLGSATVTASSGGTPRSYYRGIVSGDTLITKTWTDLTGSFTRCRRPDDRAVHGLDLRGEDHGARR